MYAKSESDMVSLDPSSPGSPKRPVYYVQSPSRDSHDGDKSSTAQPTPTDSPSHPSYARHSRASSSSRVSGTYRSSSASDPKGRMMGRKSTEDKRWADTIEEEGEFFYYDERSKKRRCQVMIAVTTSVLIFSVFCLTIWGVSRRFKPEISVKRMVVHNFYIGEGTDLTGVPTKFFTINCSVSINVYNPATFFGIHVSSMPVTLLYSKLEVATGELKYYQRRRSHHFLAVNLKGSKAPLYGAGASLPMSNDAGKVPVRLVFDIRSRGNVIGKLVTSRHRIPVSCSLVIDSHSNNNKPITFKKGSCKTA